MKTEQIAINFPSANEVVQARYNNSYDCYGEHNGVIKFKQSVEDVLKNKGKPLLSDSQYRNCILELCDYLLTSTEQAFKVNIEKEGFPIQNIIAINPLHLSKEEIPEDGLTNDDMRNLSAYNVILEIVGEEVLKLEPINKFITDILTNRDPVVINIPSWNKWMEYRVQIPLHLVLDHFIHVVKCYSPLVAISYIIAAIVIILLHEGYPNAFDIYQRNCYIWSHTVKNLVTHVNDGDLDEKSVLYYSNHAKVSPPYELLLYINRNISDKEH